MRLTCPARCQPPCAGRLLADALRGPLRALVREAIDAGGPTAAIEHLWRYVAGDAGWTMLAPALRERMQASAGTLFGIELGTYERYLPDDETLAATAAPVRLLVSEKSLPFFAEMAGRLGERLHLDVATTPGTRGPSRSAGRTRRFDPTFPARGQRSQAPGRGR